MNEEAEQKTMSEAEAKELEGRVQEFNKELLPLLGKYEIGLGASAYLQQDGRIAARPILFNARKNKGDESEVDSTEPVAPAETDSAISAG